MNEQARPANSDPLFNPLAPEFIRNPYPHYERLRAEDPMHVTPFGAFVASRQAEVSFVLRDKHFGKDYAGRAIRRYGPKAMEDPVFRSMSQMMLQQDPPDHTRLRGLVVKAFTRAGSKTCGRGFRRSSIRRSIGSSRRAGWT
nr:cytochrome P450 [Bradyrhizobium sp. Leo170]